MKDSLTGTRIRERRSIKGLRQAELARHIGISASYLNLIEHNRRRIGGKLLIDIAQVLGVEPSMLSEGAEAALIATLREAAADATGVAVELDRADEFAGRFPGWAEVLALAHRRIAVLERTVETLSDRLTHDSHLAASVHEVLSTAASIRSTASILAETGELEQKWRDKFHSNLNEDSRRLAESSKALVAYLDDADQGAEETRGVPREEAEAFMAAHDYHFPALERNRSSPDALVQKSTEMASIAARKIATEFLEQYAEDARRLPLSRFAGALKEHGPKPVALSRSLGIELAAVMRRMAAMPEDVLPAGAGMVICDGSGSLLFRKALPGFALPRFGAPCPLWPLFGALSRPMVAERRRVLQTGRAGAAFDCTAIAWPQPGAELEEVPLYRSTMVIVPVSQNPGDLEEVAEVGSSCRVCPRTGCYARHEPSILREDF